MSGQPANGDNGATPPQLPAEDAALPSSPKVVPLQPSSFVGERDTADAQQQRLMLHMPVDVRSASMALIAVILSLYALRWAQEIVVPILGGVMVSYALTPIVDRLERWKLPRAVGATCLLTLILALLGWGAWALGDQADALIDTAPTVAAKLRDLSRKAGDQTSTFKRVENAAAEIAAAAAPDSAPASGASAGATPVPAKVSTPAPRATRAARAPEAPAANTHAAPFDVRSYLLSGTLGVISFVGKVTIILFVALFLMASGNSFRRKMVKLAGPKLSQKKVTVETLDEITEQIQRYLLVQLGVSVVVGALTWLVFLGLGLNNAGVWGVIAAVTNLIPYAGALIVGGGAAVVALVQFGTLEMALIVGAASFAVHTIVGNVLTPWWMGRASKMSPVAVFIAVLIFGWLWGVWGLLLGVPILLVVKSVCDRVEDLKPVGELLGA